MRSELFFLVLAGFWLVKSYLKDSIKLLLKSISTIKGAIEMKKCRMGSRGEIYIPSGGLLGEKHNPLTYSGVVYQTTRIRNVINFNNISKIFCHEIATKSTLFLFGSRPISSRIMD